MRRRARQAVRHTRASQLLAAAGPWHRPRRHAPAALFGLALLALVLAAARPVAPLRVPADRTTIVLAIDVSGSMRSQDVAPSRFDAARAAARDLVSALPPRFPVGLVAFSGFARLLVPPARDHEQVLDAIDAMSMGRGTAIGDGLLEAVAALPGRTRPGRGSAAPAADAPRAAVILLSDGQNRSGTDPLEAADRSRGQRVTVYTVGVGRRWAPDTTFMFGGALDEETLREIARRTGGEYHHASSAAALRDVYRRLGRSLGWERRPDEVTAVLSAAGLALLLAALAASYLWVHPLGV